MGELHSDTFELTMQVVLGWKMDHPTQTVYYQLVNTFRVYAPDIHKVISVLENVTKDKELDIIRYFADFEYIRECRKVIEVNREILTLIPEISEKRYAQIAEQERKLKEIEEEFQKHRAEAHRFDQEHMI